MSRNISETRVRNNTGFHSFSPCFMFLVQRRRATEQTQCERVFSSVETGKGSKLAFGVVSPKPDRPNSKKKSFNSTGNRYFVSEDDIRMSCAVPICYVYSPSDDNSFIFRIILNIKAILHIILRIILSTSYASSYAFCCNMRNLRLLTQITISQYFSLGNDLRILPKPYLKCSEESSSQH